MMITYVRTKEEEIFTSEHGVSFLDDRDVEFHPSSTSFFSRYWSVVCFFAVYKCRNNTLFFTRHITRESLVNIVFSEFETEVLERGCFVITHLVFSILGARRCRRQSVTNFPETVGDKTTATAECSFLVRRDDLSMISYVVGWYTHFLEGWVTDSHARLSLTKNDKIIKQIV